MVTSFRSTKLAYLDHTIYHSSRLLPPPSITVRIESFKAHTGLQQVGSVVILLREPLQPQVAVQIAVKWARILCVTKRVSLIDLLLLDLANKFIIVIRVKYVILMHPSNKTSCDTPRANNLYKCGLHIIKQM